MKMPSRSLVAFTVALSLPAGAYAATQAEGWAKWVAKAEAIYAATADGQPPSEAKRQRVKAACDGAFGTLTGWSAPYWATNIVGLCRHVDDMVGEDRTISRRWGRGECMEMKEVRGQLKNGADKPNADNPGVQPAAAKLYGLADEFYSTYCTSEGRKQMKERGKDS
jgi:hypothetical protein